MPASVMRILDQAHDWIRRVLAPGDLAIDATVGNGHDTVFLAECVGPDGRVVGFDIQQAALDEAARRLQQENLAERVVLVHRGHEAMQDELGRVATTARPKVVMFNLGYRPGGDHAVITRAETTIAALDQAVDLVLPGGLITIVAYPGHAGGETEADSVLEWARVVVVDRARVACYRFLNPKTPAPFLVAVELAERAWSESRVRG
jgi:predicted methyltransferase